MKRILFFIFILLLPEFANAQELEVRNHSFEEPSANFTPGPPQEWESFKPNAPGMWTENTASTGMVGGDAFQHAGMNSFEAYIYQDLNVAFRANTIYTVEVATSHRSNFPNGILEFGLFSSSEIGTDLGLAGYSDLHGVWIGSGNPDADNLLNRFRDSTELDSIGSGSLAEPYTFATSEFPPTGNVVVFLRMADKVDQNRRIQFDNVRVLAVTIGDINCDGSINLTDVPAFLDVISSGVFEIKADINQDGVIDLLDVSSFVDLLVGD